MYAESLQGTHGLPFGNHWLIVPYRSTEENLQPYMHWSQVPQALIQVNNKGKHLHRTKSYNQSSFEEHF